MDGAHSEGRAASMRQPVNLARVDPVQARADAEAMACVAAEVLTGSGRAPVNPKTFARLCGAAAHLIHDGTAAQGLRLKRLCQEANVGEGHVRENFTPQFHDAAALTVRMLLAGVGSQVLYDLVFERWADTRDTYSLGAIDGGVRHLGTAAVSGNTCCPDRMTVMVTGTHQDPTHPAADRPAIAAFARDLQRDIPSTLVEHLELLLSPHAHVADLVRRNPKRILQGLGHPGEVGRAFPAILVVPGLTYGPALGDRDAGQPYYPGRDRAMRELAQRLRRPVMLSLGLISTDARKVDQLYPQIAPSGWAWTEHFGISNPDFGVEYRGNRKMLIRRFSHRDGRGRIGVTINGWALVNVPPEHRDKAIAICEHRAREVWYDTCLDEFRRRTEPGLLQASQPRVRAGMHALAMVGNAANVTTDRRALQSNSLES
jgi:hypothetical protein